MPQVGRENKNKKKKKRPATKSEVVDVSYLACGHHRVMVTSLALMEGFLDSSKSSLACHRACARKISKFRLYENTFLCLKVGCKIIRELKISKYLWSSLFKS